MEKRIQKPVRSLLFLFSVLVVSNIIISLIILAISSVTNIPDLFNLTTPNSNTKYVVLFSSLFTFLVPCLIFEKMTSSNWFPKEIFSRKMSISMLGLILILIVSVGISISILNIPLEWFSDDFRNYATKIEQDYNLSILNTFQFNTVEDLVWGVFIIGIIAAFIEEFFFRYVIQQQLIKLTKNPWIGIILASFVFSAFHFSIIGCIPRIILGFVLGSVFYLTRNIWYSIFFHFINNTFIVISLYLVEGGKEAKLKSLENTELDFITKNWWIGIICIGLSFYILKYIAHKYKLSKTDIVGN
ncbi:MAG: CPBP family intramembrane metalloprotease [Sediminibacterium sp.]|nr:CPBP family intramembrane metalloprotease [Sediminibacterium sp.]